MSQFIIKSLIATFKTLWSDKYFVYSTISGFIFFILSLIINYNAIKYATSEAGNSVADILLDNLPIINTDIIFSEGALFFVLFIAILLFFNPKKIPFTLKSISLFISIRSIFVIMTHLGPITNRIITDLEKLYYISSGADLFFSGHTGLPFLMALVYWENKFLRFLFLIFSIIAALAVIFGHLHYTIDVFSAFFISYGIYRLSQIFFKKDLIYFNKESL